MPNRIRTITLVFALLTLSACTSSATPEETAAVTQAEIQACVAGHWVRPGFACDCTLLESPECERSDCWETSLTNFWPAAEFTSMPIRTSAEPDGIVSMVVGTVRGDWRVDGNQLSWDTGLSNVRQTAETVCTPSRMLWGEIELLRAPEALSRIAVEHKSEDQWQSVPYEPQ